MQVTVNGSERELPSGATVAELVGEMGVRADGRGVAVALAAEVVPRSQWPTTVLNAGDRVEVLIAVQGG
jgi:sulfur carrier protein